MSNKTYGNKMKRKAKKVMVSILLATGIITLYGFYAVLETVEEYHVETIGEPEKEEIDQIPDKYSIFLSNFDTRGKQYYYTFIELEGYKYPILLLTDSVYKDNEFYVAMWADVYYIIENEVVEFGNLLSGGTAYPIAKDKTVIYSGSGHSVAQYNLNILEQKLNLIKSCTAYFNSKGEVTYITRVADDSKISTAKECEELNDKYADAKLVHFNELIKNNKCKE